MVRVKRRYILFEIMPSDQRFERQIDLKLSERDIIFAFRQTILMIYGDLGLGSVLKSLHIKKFSSATRIGIVSVQRGQHTLLTSSVAFIKKIKDLNCSIRIVRLSGTIRGCLRFLRVYYKRQINQFGRNLKAIKEGVEDLELSLGKEKEEAVEGDEVTELNPLI